MFMIENKMNDNKVVSFEIDSNIHISYNSFSYTAVRSLCLLRPLNHMN